MRLSEKEFFDSIAYKFDTKFNAYLKAAGIFRVQRRIKLFISCCNLRSGLKILEIGCGSGEYTKALIVEGINVFATDISEKMLRIARAKVGTGRGGKFFLSDVQQLPLRDNSLDVALGNSILHHLNQERSLSEILRVLKKGGYIAFSEPNMSNPFVFLQKKIGLLKKVTGESSGETAFYRRHIKRLLEKIGFCNVKVTPFDFLHPFTPVGLVGLIDVVGKFLERTFVREIAGSLLITGQK
jgi:ubiquinone/menaquinone biosynthesis C-methylase UbiE